LEQLRELPFILREEGSATRLTMEKTLKNKGFDSSRLNVVTILGSSTAVIRAIKSGVGCSILSRRAVQEELAKGTLKCIIIKKVKIVRDFYLLLRKGKTRSPLCEAFFNFLLDKSNVDVVPS